LIFTQIVERIVENWAPFQSSPSNAVKCVAIDSHVSQILMPVE